MRILVLGGVGVLSPEPVFEALDYWLARAPISSIVCSATVSIHPGDRSPRIKWEDKRRVGAHHFATQWAAARRMSCATEDGDQELVAWSRRVLAKHLPERVLAFPGGSDVQAALDLMRASGIRCIEATCLALH